MLKGEFDCLVGRTNTEIVYDAPCRQDFSTASLTVAVFVSDDTGLQCTKMQMGVVPLAASNQATLIAYSKFACHCLNLVIP